MKILVIEDEKPLAQSIETYLSKAGFIVESACDFRSACEKIDLYFYDIILLDITLPFGNGLDLISLVKEINPETGIIIISAKDSLDDKIKGLDLGSDDYLTKPFYLSELNSRINALIRRRRFKGLGKVIFNEINIDFDEKTARVGDEKIPLTKKEFELLLFFISNKNRVVTKESIAGHLWGDDIDSIDSFDFIYTHLNNLRRKIRQCGGNDYIQTLYGMGYKFTEK
jgi:DNA-binding response OmpR family regulator